MGCGMGKNHAAVPSTQSVAALRSGRDKRKSTTTTVKTKSIRDDYTIREVLGAGAFAEVRKARHNITATTRAVKIFQKEGL
jgi:hypothetical protein